VDDVAGSDGVGGVDFSDIDEAFVWIEKQTPEVCCAISSRAALRVCANISLCKENVILEIALPIMRAILTASICGFDKASSSGWSKLAAATAAHTTGPTGVENIDHAARSARSAAHSAALTVDLTNCAVGSVSRSAESASYTATTSAARSTSSTAAFVAASRDSVELNDAMFSTCLWQPTELPSGVAENHRRFLKFLRHDLATWRFWHDWYLAMWEGRFTDWDLAVEVAKIPEGVWEEGAEAVADAIREIEEIRAGDMPRPDNVPELEREKLLKYVERLLASPEMTALAAEGAAATLQRAITEYLVKADANCLPDELKHLEGMPKLFMGISVIVKSSGRSEAKILELADQIEALNGQVAKLEANLKEALTKTVNGLFKQNAIKAAGAAFGGGVVGTLGVGLAHFFGGWPDDFTLENLRGFLSQLEAATPKTEDANSLPPATDV
jgi:outer membrane murein-binding lipoprotein Lpp